jgi:hypothetical protein
MYASTFGDWFSQAVIDFMLGNRTTTVFTEFLLKLQSTDPRDLVRVTKIRAEAIATAVSRVLPEGERLLHGWTVFAPEALSTKLVDKFEEKILLLTANALYIIVRHLSSRRVVADDACRATSITWRRSRWPRACRSATSPPSRKVSDPRSPC